MQSPYLSLHKFESHKEVSMPLKDGFPFIAMYMYYAIKEDRHSLKIILGQSIVLAKVV